MAEWLGAAHRPPHHVVVIGAPIARASISPSQAWSTPPAFREALRRFPTWDALTRSDISALSVRDAGDITGDRGDADAEAAHRRIEAAMGDTVAAGRVVVVVGGDNSLTRPAFLGAQAALAGAAWGLLTLDAHHDCRPAGGGSSNGSPVRELIEGGLPGARVAQVGIHPLGNARAHADWADGQGVHVHTVDEVRTRGIEETVGAALDELLDEGADTVYVDLDIDVLDRAFAPGCPASLPGGLLPADLLAAARAVGRHPAVAAADLCEVDALADVGGVTVRVAAAAFTALCAGVALRVAGGPAR